AIAVTAGLVAALLRPIWVGVIAFALSALAMALPLGLNVRSGALILVYFLASLLYIRGVASGLNDRLRFSVQPISESQATLLTVLIAVACASFYFGYAAQIEREGFTIPPAATDMIWEGMVMRMVEGGMGPEVPESEREAMLSKAREEFEREFVGQMESTIKPYEKYMPLGMTFSLFMSLATVIRFVSWIPVLLLWFLFSLLVRLRVIKVVTETREIQRLTLS
ncbi:MAG: hypothetical protein U9R11_00920, partial [Chloroflexota bacterium]|nr:hypothetical protein [Chloroflexota bacterium]